MKRTSLERHVVLNWFDITALDGFSVKMIRWAEAGVFRMRMEIKSW